MKFWAMWVFWGGGTLVFLSPLGSLRFWDFLGFLFVPGLSYLRSFHGTLGCASDVGIGGGFVVWVTKLLKQALILGLLN